MQHKILHAVIIGAPGCGKGTISSRIVNYFGVKHISSGDLLRFNAMQHTDIGDKAQSYMEIGQLVPDHIVVKLITKELGDCKKSWLIDGFPRTKNQAEILNRIAPVDVAININVPDDVIIARISGRWIHMASGRVYNTEFNPPKVPMKDDVTGEPLVQRVDDQPEAAIQRLNVYATTIKSVLDFYTAKNVLWEVHGTESNVIWPKVYKFLATIMPPKLKLPEQ